MKKLLLLLAFTAAVPSVYAENKDKDKAKEPVVITEAHRRVHLALWTVLISRFVYEAWYAHTHPNQALLEKIAAETAAKAAQAAQ